MAPGHSLARRAHVTVEDVAQHAVGTFERNSGCFTKSLKTPSGRNATFTFIDFIVSMQSCVIRGTVGRRANDWA